jgi:hypothetical protein
LRTSDGKNDPKPVKIRPTKYKLEDEMYEYKILDVSKWLTEQELEAVLNGYGQDGWHILLATGRLLFLERFYPKGD